MGRTGEWIARDVARIVLGTALAGAVAGCGLAPTGGDVPFFIVNESPEAKPVVVRVGIGDPANWRNQGKLVAWVKVDPGTFQTLRVPQGSHLVAIVVEPPDCQVHMEQPWTSTADDRSGDPANRPFFIKGGVVDMSGWGLPITEGKPLPTSVSEAPEQPVENPCPGVFPS
jgi:hypothetical protein